MTTDVQIQNEKSEKKPQQPEAAPLPRTLKILTTCAVFYGNLTYGSAMNAFSPALTDFRNKFDVGADEISIVFVSSIICYMVGALLCSFIYNIVNRQLTVVFLFSGIAAVMFLSPHVPSLTLFYCMGGLLGFCIGCYDVAQFVWIMEMWQAESGPFIQAQHFSFAVGTMVSPLLMSPFLTKDNDDDDENSTTTTTPASTEEDNQKLFIPFTILGCLCALTAVAQLLLFIFMRYHPPPPEVKPEEANNNEAVASQKEIEMNEAPRKSGISGLIAWARSQWPGWGIAKLVILSALTLGFYQGMEICTMQFFPTFGQNIDLDLSESKAADTLTGLTGAFMAGRGLAIILIFKVPPQFILFTNIAIVLVGNIILVIGANTSLPMLWTAGVLYGLGFSSLLPSFCAYMERYLVFTNTIGAMMIVSGSAVGSLYPGVVGIFIDEYPMVLCYPVFLSVVVCTFASVTAYLITRNTEKRAAA